MALMIRRNGWPVGMVFDPSRFDEDLSPRLFGATDVYETPEAVVVESSVLGMKMEDLKISIANKTLTISGEAKQEEREEVRSYLQRQLRYGSIHQEILLPASVNAESAEATLNGGILRVVLPKMEEAKPRQIDIKPTE